jgi:cyclopropane fatty-acyl-phospholipid synthase-like methyltransferase
MNKHTDFWQNDAGLVDIADKNLKLEDCLELILPEIEPALHVGSSILDFGCGIGRLTIPVAQHFKDANLIGYDIAQQFLERAIQAANDAHVAERCYFMPNLDDTLMVDAAYSMMVLQHIPNTAKPVILERIARALNDGGIFRFQYVEGEADTFLTHDAQWNDVSQWLVRCWL